jgi:hypothetical protein
MTRRDEKQFDEYSTNSILLKKYPSTSRNIKPAHWNIVNQHHRCLTDTYIMTKIMSVEVKDGIDLGLATYVCSVHDFDLILT